MGRGFGGSGYEIGSRIRQGKGLGVFGSFWVGGWGKVWGGSRIGVLQCLQGQLSTRSLSQRFFGSRINGNLTGDEVVISGVSLNASLKAELMETVF